MVKKRLRISDFLIVLFVLVLPLTAGAVIDLDSDHNGAIDISVGGTNAKTAAGARANLGAAPAGNAVTGGACPAGKVPTSISKDGVPQGCVDAHGINGTALNNQACPGLQNGIDTFGSVTCVPANANTVGLPQVPNANPFDGSTVFTDLKAKGPWADVRAYGATCSTTTATVTATANSSNVTVNSIGDFKVGQSVVIPLAGALDAPSVPAGFINAALDGYQYNPFPGPPNLLAPAYISGACQTDSTTSSYHNASCTTTYGYTLRAVGFDGAISAPTPVTYIYNGPATISLANHIFLQWNTDPHAIGYIINRCTGAGCTPNYNSIYKVLPNLPVGQSASYAFNFMDAGNQFGHSEYTLTGSAMAGILNTTITAIGGSTVTLANAPSQTGTFTMYHDDEPAFEAAALAAGGAGNYSGTVLAPACVSGQYNFGQSMSLVGMLGIAVEGQGVTYNNQGGTEIKWLGPIGGIVFNGNYSNSIRMENIGVPSGNYNNTPGIIFDPDKYTGPAWDTYGPGGDPSGQTVNTSAWVLRNVECGESGICLEMGNPITNQNTDEFEIDHLYCDTPDNYGGWSCVHGNSQETYNESFKALNISNRDIGINFIRVGSFDAKDTNFEQNIIDFYALSISTNGELDGGVTEWGQEFVYDNLVNANLTVNNFRISPNPGPDGDFLVNQNGGLRFYGNTAESPITGNVANMAFGAGHGRNNILIGNTFTTALAGIDHLNDGGLWPATPGSEPITDTQGGQYTPQYISLGDTVNGTLIPLSVVGMSGNSSYAQKITLMNTAVRQMADTAPGASYKPSVASCGSSAAVSGTNMSMVITAGSGVTNSCAITFNSHQPFTNAPTCTFQDITQGFPLVQSSLTTAGVTLTAPSGVIDFENDTINATCGGN